MGMKRRLSALGFWLLIAWTGLALAGPGTGTGGGLA